MINKCAICNSKISKRIEVKIKQKYGYKNIDEIYLCDNCLETVKNNTDALWYYLWKNKVKGDIDGSES